MVCGCLCVLLFAAGVKRWWRRVLCARSLSNKRDRFQREGAFRGVIWRWMWCLVFIAEVFNKGVVAMMIIYQRAPFGLSLYLPHNPRPRAPLSGTLLPPSLSPHTHTLCCCLLAAACCCCCVHGARVRHKNNKTTPRVRGPAPLARPPPPARARTVFLFARTSTLHSKTIIIYIGRHFLRCGFSPLLFARACFFACVRGGRRRCNAGVSAYLCCLPVVS